MFTEFFKSAEAELKVDSNSVEYEDIFNLAAKKLYDLMVVKEAEHIQRLNEDDKAFVERNCERWKLGFQKLQILRGISIEAGMEFQKQFLQYSAYEADPLLGVLMRQHANACRITGEIICLLKGGYADGAIARWRTLFEISVNCQIIRKYGKDAAIDFIKHGKIKEVEDMEAYQKTANDMNRKPFTDEDLETAVQLKNHLKGVNKKFHWAKKYTGFDNFSNLMEPANLGKWHYDYKFACKNVHARFCEMFSLLAMSEAKQDWLVVGSSNSGMTEPAHMTAITLSQVTSAFLTAYINEADDLDYSSSVMYLSLIKKYVDDVGQEFLKVFKGNTE